MGCFFSKRKRVAHKRVVRLLQHGFVFTISLRCLARNRSTRRVWETWPCEFFKNLLKIQNVRASPPRPGTGDGWTGLEAPPPRAARCARIWKDCRRDRHQGRRLGRGQQALAADHWHPFGQMALCERLSALESARYAASGIASLCSNSVSDTARSAPWTAGRSSTGSTSTMDDR